MKIIVIDDDKLVAGSLNAIISAQGIEVCAVGHSPEEAIRLYREHKPDILLTDIRMGEQTGLDAAREILGEFPDAKILFLTTFSDEEYIFTALKIGAKGYLLKQNYESIVPSLKAVEQGQIVFGAEIVTKLSTLPQDREGRQSDADTFGLTDKELELISELAQGMSNREISEKLFLSEGTVRNYISTILEKLGLRDRTQLAIFYYKHLDRQHRNGD